jgi:hypothetical protein
MPATAACGQPWIKAAMRFETSALNSASFFEEKAPKAFLNSTAVLTLCENVVTMRIVSKQTGLPEYLHTEGLALLCQLEKIVPCENMLQCAL